MGSDSDTPVFLYIAAYADPDAAQADWDDIKELAKEKTIAVDGLVLVSRDADGTIHEKDNAHTVGVGTAIGAAGGLLVGLIFPPAFLAAGAVGAGIGAGIGGLVSHSEKKEIKDRGRGRRSARKLRDRGVVRGGLGRRHREGAAEGRQGLEARGRQGQRRTGRGRSTRRELGISHLYSRQRETSATDIHPREREPRL